MGKIRKVIIVDGFSGAGSIGTILGESYTGEDGMVWVPVIFENEEDPTYFKAHGLREFEDQEFISTDAWAMINRETGRIRLEEIYSQEKDPKTPYKCIPVRIIPREVKE